MYLYPYFFAAGHFICVCSSLVYMYSLIPRPHPLRGKRVWCIWTQSLGQGKEFERSNQITVLSKSCDYLPQEFGRTNHNAGLFSLCSLLNYPRSHFDQSEYRYTMALLYGATLLVTCWRDHVLHDHRELLWLCQKLIQHVHGCGNVVHVLELWGGSSFVCDIRLHHYTI